RKIFAIFRQLRMFSLRSKGACLPSVERSRAALDFAARSSSRTRTRQRDRSKTISRCRKICTTFRRLRALARTLRPDPSALLGALPRLPICVGALRANRDRATVTGRALRKRASLCRQTNVPPFTPKDLRRQLTWRVARRAGLAARPTCRFGNRESHALAERILPVFIPAICHIAKRLV